jgi:hypothetical protein
MSLYLSYKLLGNVTVYGSYTVLRLGYTVYGDIDGITQSQKIIKLKTKKLKKVMLGGTGG